ncbi:HTH-type transcriptional regulator CynR [Roseovarius litorisediminis]|uniref:HTH-type transcriptional regulator CynR n=1 Tax=Roseovarius litorisediminis TaxID=1312363 RepID=A0A1Y5S6K6_9RHOB|nr:LysR family transcriptional regulator [Roseovarius litorisediminis]SLN32390.1 HTH-type transcriptional regulator CynR [Roseovarius litorisediminis]
MAIKIEMLRCFRAVAEHGSLADAAATLGRTPSAVSMMLRQFEDHVGAPLFETARKSRLTPLGELVQIEANRELAHFERTVSAIEGLSQARLGHVRIAVTPSVAQTVMPPILRQYMEKHPGVRIDMMDTNSATVHRELMAERADIGLASLGHMPGFDRQPLFTDAFGVVCPVDHPLARDWSRLTWADLDGINFIANGLCDFIRDENFAPILKASHLMVHNTASILSLVRAGVGVTILPELAVLPEFTDLAFLPLVDSTARREVWMVTQPGHMLTPAARALANAIRATNISAGQKKLQSN